MLQKFLNTVRIKGELTMKIAITAEEPGPGSLIDPRFGRSKLFVIYDDQMESWEYMDNTQNLQAVQGAGIQSAANIVNAGCQVLISGHCGPKAFAALSKAGVTVYSASNSTVKDAIDLFKDGKLKKIDTADVDGHW
jgi:predicted Fe-Mo cluster-binding NifX family protein